MDFVSLILSAVEHHAAFILAFLALEGTQLTLGFKLGNNTGLQEYERLHSLHKWYSRPQHKKKLHSFHYLHVLVPFLIGLFMILYIGGLICHYRRVILMKQESVHQTVVTCGSDTTVLSDDERKETRRRSASTVSQTKYKVKKFVSSFTNMDSIQT